MENSSLLTQYLTRKDGSLPAGRVAKTKNQQATPLGVSCRLVAKIPAGRRVWICWKLKLQRLRTAWTQWAGDFLGEFLTPQSLKLLRSTPMLAKKISMV